MILYSRVKMEKQESNEFLPENAALDAKQQKQFNDKVKEMKKKVSVIKLLQIFK